MDNLGTITQKGNMEVRQITPLSLSFFSNPTVSDINFFVFENSPNLFSCGPPSSSFIGGIFIFGGYNFNFYVVDTK